MSALVASCSTRQLKANRGMCLKKPAKANRPTGFILKRSKPFFKCENCNDEWVNDSIVCPNCMAPLFPYADLQVGQTDAQ